MYGIAIQIIHNEDSGGATSNVKRQQGVSGMLRAFPTGVDVFDEDVAGYFAFKQLAAGGFFAIVDNVFGHARAKQQGPSRPEKRL